MTNGPIIVGLLPLGEPVNAFDGSIPPMFKHPRTGLRLAFNGTFTADDFVGPFAGLEMDDLISSFYTEEVYVSGMSVGVRGFAPDMGEGNSSGARPFVGFAPDARCL